MKNSNVPNGSARLYGMAVLALGLLTLAVTGRADEPAVDFDQSPGKVVLKIGGQPVATYVYRDDKISRPYFAHVHAPGGIQLTRNHPPREGDASDHATFHPGIWMAFGDISGHDYWRLKARVVHERFVKKPAGGAARGAFAVKNRYLSTDGEKTVCTETCRFSFLVRPAGYLLIWDSTFTSDSADFFFGDQEEMGLGVRVATPIAVRNGGRIADSEGRVNEKQVWGKQAAWCDYRGVIDGQQVGMTLMPDPGNFRRSWYHARDYGFAAANPFGVNAFTRGEKSKVAVKKGDSLRLRYGVLLHATEKGKPIDIAEAYRDFVEQIE